MNDIVSTSLSSLHQIYDVIAAGASARDAERVHPHESLALRRQARFGALPLPV